MKVTKVTPRKPCSANRAVCLVKIKVTKRNVLCFLPGDDKSQAMKLVTTHKQVLIQGGGPRDLPGVHYKLIRGLPSRARDSKSALLPPRRKSRRSKYGIKNLVRKHRIRLLMLFKRTGKTI